MKLKGYKTEQLNVDVAEEDIVFGAISLIRKKYNLPENLFLSSDEKELREDDEYYHGSVSDHFVRKATKKDISALKAITVLEEILNER